MGWPEGCLGYAFNLVRPKELGHRALLLHGVMGHTLVFETEKLASAYKVYTAQVCLAPLMRLICACSTKHVVICDGVISNVSANSHLYT